MNKRLLILPVSFVPQDLFRKKIHWFSRANTMVHLKEAGDATREQTDTFAENNDKSYLNERLLTTTKNPAFTIEGKTFQYINDNYIISNH